MSTTVAGCWNGRTRFKLEGIAASLSISFMGFIEQGFRLCTRLPKFTLQDVPLTGELIDMLISKVGKKMLKMHHTTRTFRYLYDRRFCVS